MIYPPRLRYTTDGFAFLSEEDALDDAVDVLVYTNYSQEVCLAVNFTPVFIADLMQAGFLVMSTAFEDDPDDFILLPKLHLVRSVLFFPNLHTKKSIKRLLNRYELRVNEDFDTILQNCVRTHGDDWLTEPLCAALSSLHAAPCNAVRPISFGVYRNGSLQAGEFGVLTGGVYTSYSGYFDESNAGTVQLILMVRYLEEHGAPFLDLGMPLPYKDELGATNISPARFVELFRAGRDKTLNDFN